MTGLPATGSPLPMTGLSNGLPANAFNPSAMGSVPQPSGLMQGLNPGLGQGAPMPGALNNVPPVDQPGPTSTANSGDVGSPGIDHAVGSPRTGVRCTAADRRATGQQYPEPGNGFGRNVYGRSCRRAARRGATCRPAAELRLRHSAAHADRVDTDDAVQSSHDAVRPVDVLPNVSTGGLVWGDERAFSTRGDSPAHQRARPHTRHRPALVSKPSSRLPAAPLPVPHRHRRPPKPVSSASSTSSPAKNPGCNGSPGNGPTERQC